jgi:E3 ubiquitin-protein ligase SIS3
MRCSYVQVVVDMIRVPDWAFEAVGLELRGMGQDTAYHPGLYLTTAQVSPSYQ